MLTLVFKQRFSRIGINILKFTSYQSFEGIEQIVRWGIWLLQVLPWKFLVFFVEKFLSFGESRQESRVFKTRICRLSFFRPRHKRKTTNLSCYDDAGLHVRSTIKHDIFICTFIYYNSYITHTHT